MKGRPSYGIEAARVMAKVIGERILAGEIRTIEDVFVQMNVKDLAELAEMTGDRLKKVKADWGKLTAAERKALAGALGVPEKQFQQLL